jgi:hypothetical protein
MVSKKITVKHYLNKRAKAKSIPREKYYPLYIQIIVNGKKAQIKSKINEHLKIYRSDVDRITKNNQVISLALMEGYVSDKFFEDIKKNKIFPLYQLLMDEVAVITRIISLQKPFTNQEFTLNNFGEEYSKYTEEITKKLDSKIKELYLAELKTIFLKTIDLDENRDVFKVVNYMIHFINWNNSFSNFYDSTFEIMPSELKSIEDLLSEELRTQMRGYLTYHSRVNLLKRFFEKREMGKISTLSYLDWETDIRDFVFKEFELLFGGQKALQYVQSLEDLLKCDLMAAPQ